MEPDINDVKRYTTEHIGGIRTIRDVAGHWQITATSLCKSWARSGEPISLGRFVRSVRVQTMIKEIRSPKRPLCFEASYAAGFRCRSTAYRCFKRNMGVSILQYRKACKGIRSHGSS